MKLDAGHRKEKIKIDLLLQILCSNWDLSMPVLSTTCRVACEACKPYLAGGHVARNEVLKSATHHPRTSPAVKDLRQTSENDFISPNSNDSLGIALD